MTDQMPLGVFHICQRGRFFSKLLYTVLTKYANTRCIRFLDALRLDGLADAHQSDRIRIAADTRRSTGQAVADGGDIVSDGRHRENLPRRHGGTEKTRAYP